MRFAWRSSPVLILALLAAAPTFAAPFALPKPYASVEGITEYRFANGFRALLLPDDSRPIVTINMTYFVGSRQEGYGETGMAHLIEHMLFRGTKRYPEMDKLYEMRGGFSNGSTSYDRTNYFISLPAKSDNLAFAVDVAFDQMTASLMRGDDLQKEFSVVRNEFEAGENNADQVLIERIMSTAYLWHNYGKSTIGSRSDIERVPIESLRAFYRRYYRPDNAMLILAGKFDETTALKLIAAHCAKLPKPKQPLPPTYTVEPVQDGERTVMLERAGEVGVVAVAYHVVAAGDARAGAAFAIGDVLTQKPWGRAYQSLVATNLATEVFNQSSPLAEPGLVIVGAKVRADQSLEKARDALLATVAELATKPITQEEIDRVEARTRKDIELQLTDPENVGLALTEYAAMGDWRLIFLARDEKLTPADVASAVKDFIKPSNRTVGMFRPTAKPDRAPLPEPTNLAAELAKLKVRDAAKAGETFESTIANIESRTERSALPSGMKLALLPKRTRGGVVTGQLTIHFGSEALLRGKLDAARMLGPMLLRGTKLHSYQQLRDAFDKLSAEVRVAGNLAESDGEPSDLAEPDEITLSWKTTRANLVPLLALLAEVLQQPSFPATEFTTLQRALLSDAEEQRHEPMAMATIELQRRMNPLPAESLHYQESGDELVNGLKMAKVETVKQLYQDLVGGSSAELALVGDFDATDIKAALANHFGAWRSPQPFVRAPHPLTATTATPTKIVLTSPDKQMAMAVAGFAFAMRDDDPDAPAMQLATTVLGAGFNSRLTTRLRTKEGISYGSNAAVGADPFDAFSELTMMAMSANPKVKRAADILREELTRWATRGITATELAEGKKTSAEVFVGELSRDQTVVQVLSATLEEGRTLEFYGKVQARIGSLTLADVNDVLKRRVDPQKLVEVIAGDVKQ